MKSAETLFSDDYEGSMQATRKSLAGSLLDLHILDDCQAMIKYNEIRGYILDLRGKSQPPQDLFTRRGGMEVFETRISPQKPLLIFGDNPILDTWKWLKLDRTNHRSPQLGVIWWPEQTLPPSMESQLRLMQLFTEWNIPLGNNSPGGK